VNFLIDRQEVRGEDRELKEETSRVEIRYRRLTTASNN
jgi:hypothetical protein